MNNFVKRPLTELQKINGQDFFLDGRYFGQPLSSIPQITDSFLQLVSPWINLGDAVKSEMTFRLIPQFNDEFTKKNGLPNNATFFNLVGVGKVIRITSGVYITLKGLERIVKSIQAVPADKFADVPTVVYSKIGNSAEVLFGVGNILSGVVNIVNGYYDENYVDRIINQLFPNLSQQTRILIIQTIYGLIGTLSSLGSFIDSTLQYSSARDDLNRVIIIGAKE